MHDQPREARGRPGDLPGQRAIEDRRDGIDVAPGVRARRVLQLLRSHVHGRAEEHAAFGRGPHLQLAADLADAKVDDFQLALSRQEDVRRLEVPMDDPGRMGCGEGIRHVDTHLQGTNDRQRRVARELGLEIVAIEELEDQEGLASLAATDVERSDDPRVADGAGDARLVPEALERGGAGGEMGVQDLQRETSLDDRVHDFVHCAHAAAAEEAFDPVAATDDRADPRIRLAAEQMMGQGRRVARLRGEVIGRSGELTEQTAAVGALVELGLEGLSPCGLQLSRDERPQLGLLRAFHRTTVKLSEG